MDITTLRIVATLAAFSDAVRIDPRYAAARAARSRSLAVIANAYVEGDSVYGLDMTAATLDITIGATNVTYTANAVIGTPTTTVVPWKPAHTARSARRASARRAPESVSSMVALAR